MMKHAPIIETRQALVAELPVTGEMVRGSLIERVVRHNRGCTICAGGGGHPMWVLTIGYSGGRRPPTQPARRTSGPGTPLAGQLSQAEGGDRSDLRAQPCAAASRGCRQ